MADQLISHKGSLKSYIGPLILVFLAYLFIQPSPIDPNVFIYPKPLPILEGVLQRNNHLQKSKKLFEGEILGPESFAADENGTVYATLQDGRIVAFKDGILRTVTRTGQTLPGCGSFDLEPVCGRPKGIKIDGNGDIIVLDAYLGMMKVNPHNGSTEMLISSKEGLDGVPFYFLNGLDITSEGLVYFTDSTTRWDRRNYRYEVLEANNLGRLMVYNPNTRSTDLLLDKLYLANGVALSRDQDFLIVIEMSACRLRKYFLKGKRKGQTEIFADNLPGYPDNIKINNKGNFYVGLGAVRYDGVSKLGPFLDLVGPYPTLKKFIAKLIPLALFDVFLPKHSIVLEIDPTGQVVSSLHDPTASVIPAAGEAFQVNNYLYIGNFKIPFIGQLDLNDIN